MLRGYYGRREAGVVVNVEGEERRYAVEGLRRAIERLERRTQSLSNPPVSAFSKGGEEREKDPLSDSASSLTEGEGDGREVELEALVEAERELESPLATLPYHRQEWIKVWQLCQTQRYGQGMTMGTLIHSEIWNNLRMLGYEGHEKERAFRVTLGIDEVFREYAEREEKRKEDQTKQDR